MTTLATLPIDILLLIFDHVVDRDLSDFLALSQSCQWIHLVAKANSQLIFGNMARRWYMPEALILLDHLRPNSERLSEAQRLRLERDCESLRSYFRVSFCCGLQRKLDRRVGVLGVVEMRVLERNEKVVEEVRSEAVRLVVEMVEMGIMMGQYYWTDEWPDAPPANISVGEQKRVMIKRAVYNLQILSGQFHLLKGPEEVTTPSKDMVPVCVKSMSWEYDWTYAAGLGLEEMFAIFGLEDALYVGERNYDDPFWKPLGMVAMPAIKAHLMETGYGSLKRFAIVNLFDREKARKREDIKGTVSVKDAFSPAYWQSEGVLDEREGKWRENFTELERLRREYGFQNGYNPKIFERREVKVNDGSGNYSMKELLTVKREGWREVELDTLEKGLIDYYKNEFLGDDGLPPETESEYELDGSYEDGWYGGENLPELETVHL
ncbi:hypothetical protein BJ508DRAFT_12733 [Ascobolus immersus RN42]|uniref:F-box domain-containing protein n=1 Tax=Ascobolus immersus RN42 TaxID=1160509 RepID=A0A3N4IFZ9_ASCIM|nr:hypothetical protein BJ508DRAFT_12733 [Ascobolus immersus RN42]